MADDVRSLRATRVRPMDASAQSSRSSLESNRPSRIASPNGTGHELQKPPKAGSGAIDFVYLKNVLLQFLEQRDRKYQMQLIPVLGMLLHFDKYAISPTRWLNALTNAIDRRDEQRWMTAIGTS